MRLKDAIAGLTICCAAAAAWGQSFTHPKLETLLDIPRQKSMIYDTPLENYDSLPPVVPADSLIFVPDTVITVEHPIPAYYFRPIVYDTFRYLPDLYQPAAVSLDDRIYGWLATDNYHSNLVREALQWTAVNHPYTIKYDEALLPEPPKKYEAKVDPVTARIVIAEVLPTAAPTQEMQVEIERRHWLHNFNGNLQFSQAYVSPNWYQGGNNNLNMLANVYWNVKLNPAFHPTFLFEATTQYKLGLNNAPDDELRDYSISDDLFQFNMLMGYKATQRWYYSLNVLFKTQLFNNYKKNSEELKGAFLSPGELNVGLGMTYNYVNKPKTFTFDGSIAPLSWNMKTCINSRMNETSFGIKEGHNVVHNLGSSAEGKIQWKLAPNIMLRSRLFMFTDYDYGYADWENTLQFTINRFLSTQIFVHARYDSSTPRCDDPDWKKLQVKEILSFGFTYAFQTK